MTQLTAPALIGAHILHQLGVTGILLVDSSSITLWEGAKKNFPGTQTQAGIKWHACFDLLSGVMSWFELTPTATPDRQCFPDLQSLKGKWAIFDLGYWDYGLLLDIENAGGFFLCRLKSTAVIYIKGIVQGLSKTHIGESLLSIDFSNKRGNIIEVLAEKIHNGETLACRVMGFWNPSEKCYHWDMTNLKVYAYVIYPLYRIRWQIELIFKACKNSLNANQIISNDKNIIESLLLASIAAHLSSHTLFNIAIDDLNEEQQLASSFQRISQVAVNLASDFISFLLNSSKYYFHNFLQKIKLFSNKIFDPNYKHRETAIMRLNRLLEDGP